MPPAWLKLGDGAAVRHGVGPKAAWLDRAKRAGLPVPEGFILLPGAQALPPLDGLWAVRSAFGVEDGGERSFAGHFRSELRVPAGEVAQAVERVRASAGEYRADVLLVRMVAARCAGVAFTERDYPDEDLTEYVDGTAEHLLSGRVRGTLAEVREWPRLARLLQGVRRVFGAGDWDVEWADDGDTCWLLQVRPITRPVRRNDWFTLANHKEILPDLPSRFMTSLMQSCAPRLFVYYRRFDLELPAGRSLIETIAGRPLLNLSLLVTMMRHWGLPTRLVTQNAGGYAEREYGWRWGRVLRKAWPLLRMAWSQATARPDARPWLRRAQQPAASLSEAIGRLGDVYVALVHGMFGFTAAMSGPLALLRAAGTLAAHQARHETVTTRMMRDWQALPLTEFVARYGHRGVYESDIARPRYAEQPPPAVPSSPVVARSRWSLAQVLTLPVWWMAAAPMRAREAWRDAMMRCFALVRQSLLEQAARYLPAPEDLWRLTTEEALRLESGWRPDEEFWRRREAEQKAWAAMRLPDLVRRFDDPAQWAGATVVPAARGLSLTAGDVAGRAWVLDEPEFALPEGFRREETVLVARSIDAGWMATMALVAGVAVETGGDLSHGSILLREIGLPAVTNLTGVTRAVRTGQQVRLKASYGVLEADESNA